MLPSWPTSSREGMPEDQPPGPSFHCVCALTLSGWKTAWRYLFPQRDCLRLPSSLGPTSPVISVGKQHLQSHPSLHPSCPPPSVVGLWKENLAKTNSKAAQSLADPTEYENLFPELKQALLAEEALRGERAALRPAADFTLVTVRGGVWKGIESDMPSFPHAEFGRTKCSGRAGTGNVGSGSSATAAGGHAHIATTVVTATACAGGGCMFSRWSPFHSNSCLHSIPGSRL